MRVPLICRTPPLRRPLPPPPVPHPFSTSPSSTARPSQLHPLLGGALGCTTGSLASVTGLGGALLILPALSHLTSISPARITAVTLVGTLATCATGSFVYVREGRCQLPLSLLVGVSSIPTAWLGVWASSRVPSLLAKRVSAVVLLITAPALVLRPQRIGEEPDGAEAGSREAG